MGNRRTAKVAEAIREVVSSTILVELRDPRIQHVTVLGVDVPVDLRSAKVRVSIMGNEAEKRLTMSGLNAACGFLQRKVGDRVNLRFTPILSFEIDDSIKKSVEASRILQELAEERQSREQGDGAQELGTDMPLDDRLAASRSEGHPSELPERARPSPQCSEES